MFKVKNKQSKLLKYWACFFLLTLKKFLAAGSTLLFIYIT